MTKYFIIDFLIDFIIDFFNFYPKLIFFPVINSSASCYYSKIIQEKLKFQLLV